jgi:hypothetical protein
MFAKKPVMMCVAAALSLCGVTASQAAVVDGTIGTEWNGITPVHVTHDINAPTSNFGTPASTTTGADYDIYARDDGNYYFVGLHITGNASSSAGLFANLYFDTDPSANVGSDLGFHVTSNDAFIPETGVTTTYDSTSGIEYATSGSDTIEFAIPNDFLTNDPLSMGFPKATNNVTLRLSQSFGYSVAGGDDYGDTRLGTAAVPEPSSLGLVGLAGLALLARRSRRRVA